MEAQDRINITQAYAPLLERAGFDPAKVFTDPAVTPWRSLDHRENCTRDLMIDGRTRRFHVKRFAAAVALDFAAEKEATGYRALEAAGIPTAPLVAWGKLADRRSFLITEDLAGFSAADKLIAAGASFDLMIEPIADLAARLHDQGLHHRDLYLCHFFAKIDGNAVELRIIDAARVRDLPGILTRQRWIVKDIAQLWFSTLALPITDAQRDALLARYSWRRKLTSDDRFRKSILLKVRWITAHDRKLNQREPARNISIPDDDDE